MNSKFNPETKVWKGIEIPAPFDPDLHLSEIVLNGLKRTPDRVVQICDDDGTAMTCDEVRLNVIRVAQNLTKIGVKDGDVVAVVCENSMDLIAYVNGIIQIGAIVNPMFVLHSVSELVNMFTQTKPRLVICEFDVYESTKEALKIIGSNAPIYIVSGEIEGVQRAESFLEPTGNEDDYKPKVFENASLKTVAILSSSGSTGPAKGVCMTQTFFLKLVSIFSESRSLNFSPIFWGSGFSAMILSLITNETRIITRKSFTPETFFEIAKRHDVTNWMTNSVSLILLLQSPLIETIDKAKLKLVLVLGSIVSDQLRKTFKEILPGKFLLIFYGLTEVSVSMTFPDQPIDGLNVGFVLPNHELKVVDDDGRALNPDEVGEIYAKYSLAPFSGYYNNPEASAAAVDADGFVKTGDIGYVDSKGFVYVIDRKKDIFKYNLHQVNPSEIENVIESMEGVELTSVVAVPNPLTCNLAAAVVIKKKGFEKLKEEDVIRYVANQLPATKQLHGGVFFVDKLPTTVSGKIIKRQVTEIAIKLYNDKHIESV